KATAFVAADNFSESGELLAQLMYPGTKRIVMVDRQYPECYSALQPIRFRDRITGCRVNNSWAIVVNVANHQRMIEFALLRRGTNPVADDAEDTYQETNSTEA